MNKKTWITGSALVAPTASAQMHSSAVEKMEEFFGLVALGDVSTEKVLAIAVCVFASFYMIPYSVARVRGGAKQLCNRIGLESLLGAFLVMGFITAPFGLYFIGHAFLRVMQPKNQDAGFNEKTKQT